MYGETPSGSWLLHTRKAMDFCCVHMISDWENTLKATKESTPVAANRERVFTYTATVHDLSRSPSNATLRVFHKLAAP